MLFFYKGYRHSRGIGVAIPIGVLELCFCIFCRRTQLAFSLCCGKDSSLLVINERKFTAKMVAFGARICVLIVGCSKVSSCIIGVGDRCNIVLPHITYRSIFPCAILRMLQRYQFPTIIISAAEQLCGYGFAYICVMSSDLALFWLS